MRIAIIGRTGTLYHTAERLRKRYDIGMIVTAKEAPEYDKTAEDFESLARTWEIPFFYTAKIGEIKEEIGALPPFDLGISMNYSGIIPEEVIGLFRLGILNAHGGDLPRYRGNACQAWALINGEERIGLCIHKMIGGEIDSGEIISRDYLPVSLNTRIGEVYRWMDRRVPDLFLDAAHKLNNDPEFLLEKQSTDPKDILRCYPRIPSDGEIDWKDGAKAIVRLVNVSSEPYPGAFTQLRGHKCIIWRAEWHEENERWCGIPGQVVHIDRHDGGVIVLTGNRKVKVREMEYEGERDKPARWITSTRERFGEV